MKYRITYNAQRKLQHINKVNYRVVVVNYSTPESHHFLPHLVVTFLARFVVEIKITASRLRLKN